MFVIYNNIITSFKILLPGITLKQNVFEIEKVQEIVLENCMKGVNCELGVVPVLEVSRYLD